jgi:hypothetical protein
MSPVVQSSLIGGAFAATAVILFVAALKLILQRRRSAYTVLLGLCAVLLLIGPAAIIQLSEVQSHFGIVRPQEREAGFNIYVAVLFLLAVFTVWKINGYNKRYRKRMPTI